MGSLTRRTAALGLILTCLVVSCGRGDKPQPPEKICGTPVDWELAEPLVESAEDLHEYSRVDRSKAISAPCTLFSGDDREMEFNFYWTSDAPGLAQRSEFDPVLEGVSQFRKADIGDEAVIGRNGAIVSVSCITDRGRYFTLKLHLPQASILDEANRAKVEKFMRAYFPAAVKTLDCR
ncbi:hypothetical protein [Streptomyces sp. CB02400]|uniref:hypothetical protein n=1 Tax=unclassified Streptomyces TaxID=2593676 RepID=UPI00116138FC|nr:hypothetical protein [Streptomyces sp. CB02400]